MKKTDILIIGGGIAGTTTAETVRAKNKEASIIIVSAEQRPLYSRVLLPHAIKEKISLERTALKRDDFYGDMKLEYWSGVTVVGVDTGKKSVQLDDGGRVSYGKMVIATGGSPKIWDVPGADLEGVMRLQTYEDAREITARAKLGGEMVIVGTGFIALEFAAIALHYGLPVKILNRSDQFCASLMGPGIARATAKILAGHGIEIMNQVLAREIVGSEEVEGVRLSDGSVLPCTMVGVGIGLDLNVDAFEGLNRNNGILANEYLETGVQDVWVAGDCAEFQDTLLGIRHTVGNWTNAMAQGRHVGRALLGERAPYEALTSYTSLCVPGVSLIFLGETRSHDRSSIKERVIEEGKKVVEFRIHRNRIIGAILLNAPELRAVITELITSKTSFLWKKGKLVDTEVLLEDLLK